MTSYLGSLNDDHTEAGRLRLLETCRDPGTIRRLDRLGVGPGWRCLEVGAGRGSIARRLAERVGPTGTVVAADLDPRFLVGLPGNVQVRRVDVREQGFEPGAYDLVHCRALLMHLPDPAAALARLVAALRPGGVLLAEEGDFGLLRFDGHPAAARLNALVQHAVDRLAAERIMDGRLGRTLPGLVQVAGIRIAGSEVETAVTVPGEPAHAFEEASALAAADNLLRLGILTEADAALVRSYFAEPDTVITTLTMVAVWGHAADGRLARPS